MANRTPFVTVLVRSHMLAPGMHAQVVHTACVSLYAQSQIVETLAGTSLIVRWSHAGLLAVA